MPTEASAETVAAADEGAAAWAGERLEAVPVSAFLPLRCSITPSRRLSRESSSASCGRFDLRGARPGGGKTHSIPALMQFEQGDRLLHRTFLRRHVTQLRELDESATNGGAVVDEVGALGLVIWGLLLAVRERFSSEEADGNDMAYGWGA